MRDIDALYSAHERVRSQLMAARRRGSPDVPELERKDRRIIAEITDLNWSRYLKRRKRRTYKERQREKAA